MLCIACKQAQKEAARKFLEQGSYDFSFSDNTIPTSEAHETVVRKANKAQILHLVPNAATVEASQRLAAKKQAVEQHPRHLQGVRASRIHLGLGDDVVNVEKARRVAALPQKRVRADDMQDKLVKGQYPLQ